MQSSKGRTAGLGFQKPPEVTWAKRAFSGSDSGDLVEYIFLGAYRKGTGRTSFFPGLETAGAQGESTGYSEPSKQIHGAIWVILFFSQFFLEKIFSGLFNREHVLVLQSGKIKIIKTILFPPPKIILSKQASSLLWGEIQGP